MLRPGLAGCRVGSAGAAPSRVGTVHQPRALLYAGSSKLPPLASSIDKKRTPVTSTVHSPAELLHKHGPTSHFLPGTSQPYSTPSDHQQQHGWTSRHHSALKAAASILYRTRPHGGSRLAKAEAFDTLWRDIRKISVLAGPLLVQYVIGHMAHMIDTSFVGHLEDPATLSAMVLGGSLSMATGYSVISGLASASETLSGQAAGARNTRALAITLQRSLAVCAAALAPITCLWFYSEPLLTAMGQTPDIAAGAARYLQLTVPALYLYMVHDCLDKHLVAQGLVQPGVVITAVSTALTPLYCWFFVNHLDLQLDGAAYAYVTSQATSTLLTLGYMASRQQQTAGTLEHVPLRPSAAALRQFGPYLSLAVPATIMYCMEGWATQVLIFLSGSLDNAEVAVGVTGLCLQFSTLVWLAAASISSATATRIANHLGKGDAAAAKRTVSTALGMVLASQVLVGLAAYSWRSELVGLMTSQQDVLALTGEVLPVLALCFVFDGQNAVLSSVLRGAGRQWTGAGLNLLGWWCVGVPAAYFLAFNAGMNVHGLWAGFAGASALQALVQLSVVSRMDWEEEVERAQAMIQQSAEAAESSTDEEDDSPRRHDGEGVPAAAGAAPGSVTVAGPSRGGPTAAVGGTAGATPASRTAGAGAGSAVLRLLPPVGCGRLVRVARPLGSVFASVRQAARRH